jgi:hypothetical protein
MLLQKGCRLLLRLFDMRVIIDKISLAYNNYEFYRQYLLKISMPTQIELLQFRPR